MALTPIGGPGVGRMLAIGTLRGMWTLEDLDKPSPGWAEIEDDRVRSLYPFSSGSGRPTMRYPGAGTRMPYRNLAREWIEANPQEWQRLVAEYLAAEQAGQSLDKNNHAKALP